MYKIIALALLVFSISQILLIRNYERTNQRLQDALAKCAGLKETSEGE
jgi:hypothetical protein